MAITAEKDHTSDGLSSWGNHCQDVTRENRRSVFELLRREGPLTQREIRDRLRMSPSVVHRAMHWLLRMEFVVPRPYLEDMRRSRFHVRDGSHLEGENRVSNSENSRGVKESSVGCRL